MTTFISLGTGDSAHATLADLDIIRDASLVIVPGRRAEDIVRKLCSDARIRRMDVPMNKDRQSAIDVYDEIVKLAEEREDKHLDTVIAVEGDVSIYASIHYVMDTMKAHGYSVRQQPGVTSFIAAAAMAGISLVSGDERMLLAPGMFNPDDLNVCDTLVLLKPKRSEKQIKEFIADSNNNIKEVYYFENIDSPNALFLSNIEEIIIHDFPYFALMILRKAQNT